MTNKEQLINQMSCMSAKKLAIAITTCCPSAFKKHKCKRCTKLGCEECWEKFLSEETTDPHSTLYQTIIELSKFKDRPQVIFNNEAVNTILHYLKKAYVVLSEEVE